MGGGFCQGGGGGEEVMIHDIQLPSREYIC